MNMLPESYFLSAPLWLITVLHVLTLTLHFVAMNFLVGGIIVVLAGKFSDKWNHPVVKQFVKLFPVAMAATVTIGIAPLLFVQLVYPRQMYSAAIVCGWFFLLIVFVVIAAYYLLYGGSFAKAGSKRVPALLFLALAGLLYVSVVYSNVFSLAERPGLCKALYARNQSGLMLNPEVGSWIFRWLHMMLGAVTVGGFFVGLLGRKHDDAFKVGKTFFIGGMAVAMLSGFVYLFSMMDLMKPLMHSAGAWWLLGSIVLALGSLHFFMKRKFAASGGMLFVSLLGMVAIRHIVRLLRLDGAYAPSSVPVHPQWDVFLPFLVCFLVALGVVGYMLKLYFGRQRPD
ncbi:MAG: hypothetical protein K9M54_02540 [Kiritimatiellales bacterium]|nr:hypothetical protein [Kiritimatiellales bacterium]